jgi:hypothetical protein
MRLPRSVRFWWILLRVRIATRLLCLGTAVLVPAQKDMLDHWGLSIDDRGQRG